MPIRMFTLLPDRVSKRWIFTDPEPYDSYGKRLKKTVGNQETYFVCDAFGKLAAEYTTNQTITAEGAKFLTADLVGSPRIATNNLGQAASRHDYMPFGEEIAATVANRNQVAGFTANDRIRQQFTGYERDGESGLDFAQNRYFSARLGRFTSVDPLAASASAKNPQTLNRYTYALNSPYKFTDPLGLAATQHCWGNICNTYDADEQSARGSDDPVYAPPVIRNDGYVPAGRGSDPNPSDGLTMPDVRKPIENISVTVSEPLIHELLDNVPFSNEYTLTGHGSVLNVGILDESGNGVENVSVAAEIAIGPLRLASERQASRNPLAVPVCDPADCDFNLTSNPSQTPTSVGPPNPSETGVGETVIKVSLDDDFDAFVITLRVDFSNVSGGRVEPSLLPPDIKKMRTEDYMEFVRKKN